MDDMLYDEIRLLGREIQAIKPNEEIDYHNQLVIIKETRKMIMDVYYDKNWDVHKWMMDSNPSYERKKSMFLSYVDDALQVKEREKIASKMIEEGWEVEKISELTNLPLRIIKRLKGEEEDFSSW